MSAITTSFRRWSTPAQARPALLSPPVALAVVWLTIVIVVAIAAPVLAPHSPNATDLTAIYSGPSSAHLLGTDELGRDTLSRLIYGSRTGLLGPLFLILLTTAFGGLIGLVAAWKGGRADTAISVMIDILLAFPGLLLAILAVAIFGVGLTAPVIALAISYTPYLARLIRGAAIRERAQPYVAALSIQGFGGVHICLRHLLPNISRLIFSQAALAFGYALVDLAAISFLGLGVQPPTSDWGELVADGQAGLVNGHPQVSIYAGVVIVLTVLAVNVIGERVAQSEGLQT
jgi:peptide/nickel transport system permease protein